MKNIVCFSFITLLLLVLLSCYNREQIVDKRTLANNDFRLFQATPAWELAKSVADGDREKIYRILRDNPNMVNYLSPVYGVTVLHLAVQHQNLTSINCLLELNADVNIRDTTQGDTPLNIACSLGSNNMEIVEKLIQYGANVNVTDLDSTATSCKLPWSPLISACYGNCIEAVKLLIDKGADINYAMDGGTTALGECIILEHYKIAYYLLLHGADYTLPIMRIKDISKKGNGKTIRQVYIKELLEGSSIDYISSEKKYYHQIVAFLREKGINVNEVHP